MEPRFTRGEYWLLETVVEHEWEICGLIDDDLELHLSDSTHNLKLGLRFHSNCGFL